MTTGRILTWLRGDMAPRRSLRLAAACVAAVCAWALPVASAYAEGSVDFNTGADTRLRNYLEQYGAGGNYTVLRVYARAGETIQMASSVMGLAGGQDDIRVYAPGTSFASSANASAQAPFPTDPVFSTAVFDCNVDDPGTGRIASRAEELAGPAPNPGGYVACEFTAPSDGIYPVVMIPYDPVTSTFGTGRVGTPGTTTAQGHAISMWDVTVRAAGGAVQPGRLFANRLTLAEGGGLTPTNAPNPVAYLYTPAGYQYRVSFFAHNGVSWFMAADGKGVVDAASGQRLFASFDTTGGGQAIAPLVVGGPDLALDARYPIFFRQPDPIAISGMGGLAQTRGYATAPISPSGALTSLAFTGAGGEQGATARGSGGTIRFTSPAQMAGLGYTVAVDVNGNGTFGDANDFVDGTSNLAGSGANAFAWNGHDANGAAPPCGATYRYQVRSTLAEVHLTQFDVENSGGTQIERLSLPSDPALGNPLAASYNDVDPYKHAAVTNTSPSAATDGVSGPGFHAWTGGSGNDDLVDTWMRLPEVASTGSFQLGCVSDVSLKKTASATRVTVGDTVTYTLTAANAGPDGAPDVTVTDTAPPELDVRSATTTQGRCTVTGNKVSCPIGALASGASAKVTVKVVAIKAGLTTNTAIVDAPPPTVDPPANDTGKATVRVVRPTLRLTKTANRGSVSAGGTVTYTIRASNPSKRSVRNVRVCDRLPSGLVYVSSESEAKLTKSGYCWTAKALWAGRSQTYRITVRAVDGTSGRKVNQATASSSGANPAHASRTVRVLAARVLGGGVTG